MTKKNLKVLLFKDESKKSKKSRNKFYSSVDEKDLHEKGFEICPKGDSEKLEKILKKLEGQTKSIKREDFNLFIVAGELPNDLGRNKAFCHFLLHLKKEGYMIVIAKDADVEQTSSQDKYEFSGLCLSTGGNMFTFDSKKDITFNDLIEYILKKAGPVHDQAGHVLDEIIRYTKLSHNKMKIDHVKSLWKLIGNKYLNLNSVDQQECRKFENEVEINSCINVYPIRWESDTANPNPERNSIQSEEQLPEAFQIAQESSPDDVRSSLLLTINIGLHLNSGGQSNLDRAIESDDVTITTDDASRVFCYALQRAVLDRTLTVRRNQDEHDSAEMDDSAQRPGRTASESMDSSLCISRVPVENTERAPSLPTESLDISDVEERMVLIRRYHSLSSSSSSSSRQPRESNTAEESYDDSMVYDESD